MKTKHVQFPVSFEQPWFIWLGDPQDDATPILKQYGFDTMNQPSPHRIISTQATWILTTLENVDHERKWMKKASRKGAIGAIFLALDVNDFISSSHDALKMLAGRYRQRIRDLQKQLKSPLPVYGLWIYTDTIPGFKEFWGKNLNLWSIGTSIHIHEEWQAKHLTASLQSLRVVHNPKQKLELLQSQVEWRQLLINWEKFSNLLLAPNPYQSEVTLEGYFIPNPDPIRPTSHALVAHCHPIQTNQDWTRLTLLLVLVLYLFSSVLEAFWSNKIILEKIRHSDRQSITNLYDIVELDQHPKWNFQWGFQRFNELKSLSAQALNESFKTDILSPLMMNLKEDLDRYIVNWKIESDESRGRYYLTYKLYRILSDPKKKISPEVAHAITDYWLTDVNTTLKEELLRKQWYTVFSLLLKQSDRSELKGIEPRLIARVQQQLQSSAISNNIYGSWKAEEAMHGRWMTFEDLLQSRDSVFVSDKKLPWIYTRPVWHHFNTVKLPQLILQANDDRWLFNEPDESPYHRKIQEETQREELLGLYRQDYFAHWVEFIGHIKVRSSKNLKSSVNQIKKLIKHPNQLAQVFDLIQEQLSVIPKRFKKPRALKFYYSDLSRVIQNPEEFSLVTAKHLLKNDQSNALIQSEHQLTQWLQEHYSSPDLQRSLKRWLFSPLNDLGQQILRKASLQLQKRWSQDVYAYYQQKILPYYPMSRHGSDLPVGNFTEFYHLEHGKLAMFIRDPLQTSQGTWHGVGLNILPEAQQQRGLPSHQLNFEIIIKPVAQIKEIAFTLNNQSKRYQNQPEEWSEFIWQVDTTPNELTLRVLDNQNRELLKYNFHDAWAIWHWLATADSMELREDVLWAKWKLQKSNRELMIGIRTKKYPKNEIATLLTQGLPIPETIIQPSTP